MAIIERAIKKLRRPGPLRSTQRAVIDPAMRLVARPGIVDREACRERRVLLGSQTDEEKVYAATYRMLRTRLLHRARTNDWTTIAVTSAGPNDGKTLTVINLALSMAREKTRDIVLLDLDMRNPSVCRSLGVQPKVELRTHLEQGGGVQDLFFSVASENLFIAGSIIPTEHASELLSGLHFDDLIQTIVQGTADPVILLDLPPVLVTDDALVVAPRVDAVLVVASEGITNRSDLARALHLLSEFPMAGVVLNRASASSPNYSYAYDADADFRPGRD
jgi:Mrp family chromosome partitioning ATPase